SGELADDQKSAWTKISGKPTSPSMEEMATEHQADGTHGAITPTSCTNKYTHPTTGTCPQAPKAHESTHVAGGSDDIDSALADAAIPNLNASKITAGRFGVARLPAMTDEKIWKGTGGNVEEIDVPSGGLAIFGDGSDGDITVNADPFTSGTLIVNNILQRDAFFNNLTINVTRKLEPNGYRIFVKDTLTNNGTIENNGGNGGNAAYDTPGAAGASSACGSIGASNAGAIGATSPGVSSGGGGGGWV
ncbi:unnamed protein product, partial [marine sediment metagenome]